MGVELITHNSYEEFYRSPFGAVPCKQTITLRIKVSGTEPVRVNLRLRQEGQHEEDFKMELVQGNEIEKVYEKIINVPEHPGLLWYYFVINAEKKQYLYGNNFQHYGGQGEIYTDNPAAFQITVYKEDAKTPNWFKEAVMYQIFVDRFYNGNLNGKVLNPKKNSLLHLNWDDNPLYIKDDQGKIMRWSFFGGNLQGVNKKISYLKELGINLIYFNPIFEASSNHKYDTGDYHKIDPMFGDNELFAQLCENAKESGIEVILDGVFSHTGSDSIYFNKEGQYDSLGAHQSSKSPYYSWYSFLNCDKYECWWQIETLPNINETDPSYQDFIIFNENSVLKHWHRMGTKGWRLDVVDELPDDFIKKFYKTLKECDPEAILIGEVWEDASNKESYGKKREYLLGEELDSVMNYPFRDIVLGFLTHNRDSHNALQALMNLFENYPTQHFYSMMNLIDSHDVERALTVFKDNLSEGISTEEKDKFAIASLKMAVLWQMTFPGVPCVYYGDEVGVEGGKDPQNRRTYPWGKENIELLEFYKKVIALRNHYDVLKTGSWIPLETSSDVLGFTRMIQDGQDLFGQRKKDNFALIVLNRNMEDSVTITLDLNHWHTEFIIDALENYKELPLDEGKVIITLAPQEGKVYLKDRWGSSDLKRECGVLLHPTSLSSRYGIGGLGKEAYNFVDFLVESKQKLWQILPLNPPCFGASPYQCLSAFAGNDLLIDPEGLISDGLLTLDNIGEIPNFSVNKVDFDQVRIFKDKVFEIAFKKFTTLPKTPDYERFLEENNDWLEDYAFFIAIKDHYHGEPWYRWEKTIAQRQGTAIKHHKDMLEVDIEYHKFIQYIFYKQWGNIKGYANSKGIKIIGDLPIFVAHDSSDVWVNPKLFELDIEGNVVKVAGVPPDYFSENGQRWGNPLYKWEEMAQDEYLWWRQRIKMLLGSVDVIRIDHFRGFEGYWEIPAEEETAVKGKWVKGPGEKFFTAMKEHLGIIPIIAEDLGFITPEVHELRTKYAFPGMKILQFELEGEGLKLPLNEKNTVLYTGSHDNDTMLGWYKKNYKHKITGEDEKEVSWRFIETVYHSDAETVIVPIQDILCLDSEARMNTPGTLEGNWQWRILADQISAQTSQRLSELVEKYHR